jgi:hypothetical protein
MAKTFDDIRLVDTNPCSKPYAKTIVNDEYIIFINTARAGLISSKKSLDTLLEEYNERFQNLVLEESAKILGKDYKVRKIRVHIDERITKAQYDILYPQKKEVPETESFYVR